VLCLVETSASMNGRCQFRGRPVSCLRAARLCVDGLVDLLLRWRSEGDPRARNLEVGVLGFRGEGGAGRFVPLLPGRPESVLVPLAGLADQTVPRRKNGVGRWVQLPDEASGDDIPVSLALAHAHLWVGRWLSRNPGARPPLVVLVSDHPESAAQPGPVARSLQLLGSEHGACGFVHCLLTDTDTRGIVRGVALNTTPYPLIEKTLRGKRPRPQRPAPPGACSIRGLSLEKAGNAESECEDVIGWDEAAGVATLSDGASEGIFVRVWGELLVRSYLDTRPDVKSAVARRDWVMDCRRAWIRQIGYPTLRWSQQNKVNDVGAAGTFLAWELGRADEAEGLAWRAWAVGDGCLFWTRDGALRASFPVVHWAHFGVAPALLRSRADVPAPAPLFASGQCQPGDLFFLASDAVAQTLLYATEKGSVPAWNELAALSLSDWRGWVEALRKGHGIVNDDSSLVVIQING
jgi:hypothetical protein